MPVSPGAAGGVFRLEALYEHSGDDLRIETDGEWEEFLNEILEEVAPPPVWICKYTALEMDYSAREGSFQLGINRFYTVSDRTDDDLMVFAIDTLEAYTHTWQSGNTEMSEELEDLVVDLGGGIVVRETWGGDPGEWIEFQEGDWLRIVFWGERV